MCSIFLVFHMSGNFRLSAGYLEYYIMEILNIVIFFPTHAVSSILASNCSGWAYSEIWFGDSGTSVYSDFLFSWVALSLFNACMDQKSVRYVDRQNFWIPALAPFFLRFPYSLQQPHFSCFSLLVPLARKPVCLLTIFPTSTAKAVQTVLSPRLKMKKIRYLLLKAPEFPPLSMYIRMLLFILQVIALY